MEVGTKIDSFSLKGIDAKGKEITFSLNDYKGKNIVLYFYPKDNTPGCTQEACDFRDNFNRLTSLAQVVGVSPDSVESHIKFQAKHDLNFILLSDPEHSLMTKFGAWGEKMLYGKVNIGVIRSTFIINKEGTLVKSWKKVSVKGHVDKVIEELKKL